MDTAEDKVEFLEYKKDVIKFLAKVTREAKMLGWWVNEAIQSIKDAESHKEVEMAIDVLCDDVEEELKHISLKD